jgi:hypothetical protein
MANPPTPPLFNRLFVSATISLGPAQAFACLRDWLRTNPSLKTPFTLPRPAPVVPLVAKPSPAPQTVSTKTKDPSNRDLALLLTSIDQKMTTGNNKMDALGQQIAGVSEQLTDVHADTKSYGEFTVSTSGALSKWAAASHSKPTSK